MGGKFPGSEIVRENYKLDANLSRILMNRLCFYVLLSRFRLIFTCGVAKR